MMRLHVPALGLTLGIMWGGAVLLTTLLHMAGGWFQPWVDLMKPYYLGQGPTLLGALTGLVAGFIDAFIFGVVAAAIYNGLTRRLGPHQEPPAEQ